ncbi:MAG: hypothetical protein ACK56I_37160, partial [bacterium]
MAGGAHWHRRRPVDGRPGGRGPASRREDRPEPPHFRPHPGVEGRAVRPDVGQVVPLQHQPGGEARP